MFYSFSPEKYLSLCKHIHNIIEKTRREHFKIKIHCFFGKTSCYKTITNKLFLLDSKHFFDKQNLKL